MPDVAIAADQKAIAYGRRAVSLRKLYQSKIPMFPTSLLFVQYLVRSLQ